MTLSCASSCRARESNDASANLIEFDGFEQCLEIAFAETLVSLALDYFEEDGADHVGREDLQQDTLVAGTAAVDENSPAAQLLDIFVMSGHTRIDAFVIGLGRVLERHTASAQHVDGAVDLVSGERDVLNSFAAVFTQVFLDLRFVVLRFVDGDADLATGAGERARDEPGLLAFDVESLRANSMFVCNAVSGV